ncbi:hypothetical protein HHL19_17025 [Streptomyces sp. R302]|uniref:DUF6223 family protein n=1 Tax=unclassified Streptomyces TaxID=2593676 RepID=UPI00145D8B9D|nr:MULTISPECIES: DUF6223 family protein [unclassified Streptomyces]NML52732.1 hypothetical protein [Streptomyces sp. R301]NML80339.1 hypothetical protein [Streptomyces sp. R302]
MNVRRLLATGTAAVLAVVATAASAVASAPAQTLAASVTTFSVGRLAASAGAVIGLIGLVAAWRALTRPTARRGARLALAAGPVAVVLGAVVAATADGGLGTGNGLGGAYVALLVGLAATALGVRAHARARRTD